MIDSRGIRNKKSLTVVGSPSNSRSKSQSDTTFSSEYNKKTERFLSPFVYALNTFKFEEMRRKIVLLHCSLVARPKFAMNVYADYAGHNPLLLRGLIDHSLRDFFADATVRLLTALCGVKTSEFDHSSVLRCRILGLSILSP